MTRIHLSGSRTWLLNNLKQSPEVSHHVETCHLIVLEVTVGLTPTVMNVPRSLLAK